MVLAFALIYFGPPKLPRNSVLHGTKQSFSLLIIFQQQEINDNHAKYTFSLIYDSETVFASDWSFN